MPTYLAPPARMNNLTCEIATEWLRRPRVLCVGVARLPLPRAWPRAHVHVRNVSAESGYVTPNQTKVSHNLPDGSIPFSIYLIINNLRSMIIDPYT